jgi:hypothetical protein
MKRNVKSDKTNKYIYRKSAFILSQSVGRLFVTSPNEREIPDFYLCLAPTAVAAAVMSTPAKIYMFF